MAERVAAGAQGVLELGAAHPGAEGGEPVLLGERVELLEALEGHGEDGGITGRDVDVADDAGATAVGDEAGAHLVRVGEQGAHFLGVAGKGDPIREGGDAPAAHDDEVGEALPARMAQTELGVGGDERVGWQPGGRDGSQHVGERGIAGRRTGPDTFREDSGGTLRQRVADGGVSPSIPAPQDCLQASAPGPGAPH